VAWLIGVRAVIGYDSVLIGDRDAITWPGVFDQPVVL
jgi:hypothetical protein